MGLKKPKNMALLITTVDHSYLYIKCHLHLQWGKNTQILSSQTYVQSQTSMKKMNGASERENSFFSNSHISTLMPN